MENGGANFWPTPALDRCDNVVRLEISFETVFSTKPGKKRILTTPAVRGLITRRSRRRPKSTVPLWFLKFRLKPLLQQNLEKK